MENKFEIELKGVCPRGVLLGGRVEYGLKIESVGEDGKLEVYVMSKEEILAKSAMIIALFGLTLNDVYEYIRIIDRESDKQEEKFTIVEDFLRN